jgi:hypothetical protein
MIVNNRSLIASKIKDETKAKNMNPIGFRVVSFRMLYARKIRTDKCTEMAIHKFDPIGKGYIRNASGPWGKTISFPAEMFPSIRKLKTQARGGSTPVEKTEAGNGNSKIAGKMAIIKNKKLLVLPETERC